MPLIDTAAAVLTGVGVLGTAVVYGADIVSALAQRPAFRELDDAALTASAGWGHYYAGKRMPIPAITGMIAMAIASALSFAAGSTAASVCAGAALVPLVVWLVVFNRISLPVNNVFIAHAKAGTVAPNAQALQARWDSVVGLRVALQFLSMGLLCAALVLV